MRLSITPNHPRCGLVGIDLRVWQMAAGGEDGKRGQAFFASAHLEAAQQPVNASRTDIFEFISQLARAFKMPAPKHPHVFHPLASYIKTLRVQLDKKT